VLFQELALAVGAPEGIDQRVHHLDTTSFSLTGAYVPDRDEHAMTITHGDAKDHRPDLKPAGLALMVSQDGGVPCVSQGWEGPTSDLHVFQERAQALMPAFAHTPRPRSLVADATRYHTDHAPHLKHLGFITRMPNTLGLVSQVIRQALTGDTWHPVDDHNRDQRLE
jgi:transposase